MGSQTIVFYLFFGLKINKKTAPEIYFFYYYLFLAWACPASPRLPGPLGSGELWALPEPWSSVKELSKDALYRSSLKELSTGALSRGLSKGAL